jgi:hypothetical protein
VWAGLGIKLKCDMDFDPLHKTSSCAQRTGVLMQSWWCTAGLSVIVEDSEGGLIWQWAIPWAAHLVPAELYRATC